MTADEFHAWLQDAAKSMRALDQAARHRSTAALVVVHDAELARLYRRWAEAQQDIEDHVAHLSTRVRRGE